MEQATSEEIAIALRLLERNRRHQRLSYERHKEDRKVKRREYYYKKKAELEEQKKAEDEVKFKEAVDKAVQKQLGEVV
jgi:hypothetical protein